MPRLKTSWLSKILNLMASYLIDYRSDLGIRFKNLPVRIKACQDGFAIDTTYALDRENIPEFLYKYFLPFKGKSFEYNQIINPRVLNIFYYSGFNLIIPVPNFELSISIELLEFLKDKNYIFKGEILNKPRYIFT